MRIDVITLFPEMFDALLDHGVSSRAFDRGLLDLRCWNPRDDAPAPHRNVDDRPYGGGPGMVMKAEPLRDCLGRVRADRAGEHGGGENTPPTVIYLSPQGRLLDQAGVAELAAAPHLILLAGRYEGVDERLLATEVDAEYSIGDYVLSGGELAAMVLIDAVTRLLPGALGDARSAQQDSFGAAGDGLLDHPHYTRPPTVDGLSVPPVLLGGDHDAIRRWRLRQALGRTWLRRPELLSGTTLNDERRALLNDFIREHQHAADTGVSP